MLTLEGAPPTSSVSEAYSVPEGVAADGILGGQCGTTQHDEDEDEVGEDVVVNELVAAHTDPVEKSCCMDTAQTRVRVCWAPAGQDPAGRSVVCKAMGAPQPGRSE